MVPASKVQEWKTKHENTLKELAATKDQILKLVPRSERDEWLNKYEALNKRMATLVPTSQVQEWKLKQEKTVKELVDTKEQISKLVPRSERDEWKRKHDELKAKLKAVPKVTFDAKLVKEAYGKRVKQDDLKIVEGIGPKIEQLFHNFNLKTWKA